MNIEGHKVKHKSFGEGVVISHDENNLTVNFQQGDKKFIYPNAFKSFISAVDPAVDAAVKQDISDLDEKAAIIEANKAALVAVVSRSENPMRPMVSEPRERQYFFVFQNKTFSAEQRGEYLWAPKSTMEGHSKSHWKLMNEVRQGDVIFHSVSKNIVAISVAVSNCYSSLQPPEFSWEKIWGDDGWRVDCKYTNIRYPIITSDYINSILELQPSQNAPFNVLGRGNTGYLFASNYALSKFLFDKLKATNDYLEEDLIMADSK